MQADQDRQSWFVCGSQSKRNCIDDSFPLFFDNTMPQSLKSWIHFQLNAATHWKNAAAANMENVPTRTPLPALLLLLTDTSVDVMINSPSVAETFTLRVDTARRSNSVSRDLAASLTSLEKLLAEEVSENIASNSRSRRRRLAFVVGAEAWHPNKSTDHSNACQRHANIRQGIRQT